MIKLEAGDFGWDFLLVDIPTRESILIQTDWDYPWAASIFGWRPCHNDTDGTVDCPICGKTVHELLNDAYDYLYHHIGDEAEDPGYFF